MNSTICQSSLISCPRSWRTPCRYSFFSWRRCSFAASDSSFWRAFCASASAFPVLSVRQLQPFALQRLLFSDAAVLCQKAVCQAVAAPRLTTAHQLPDRLTTADQPPDRLTTADQPPDRLWVLQNSLRYSSLLPSSGFLPAFSSAIFSSVFSTASL